MTEPANKKRRLSPPHENGGITSVPGFAKWDLERDYQLRLQKKNKKTAKPDKLLIKTADGQIKANPRIEAEQYLDEEEVEDSEVGEKEDGDADSAIADIESRPVVKRPTVPPREQIRQAKEELAKIANQISGNPEENIGQLGALSQISKTNNTTVQKLGLLTQLAIFKDIIPSYRIRPITKDGMQEKVSKDVKKLRSFEQGLLNGYKEYIQTLTKLAANSSTESAASLAIVAINCACTLLTSVPHFNCRPDLIAILVKKLANRRLNESSEKCRQAIETLFQEDEEGNASLDVVGQITKMMKGKNYNVHESVLNTFLHLRLLSEFAHKASTNSIDKDEDDTGGKKRKQKKEYISKKQRKVLKERKQVEKEMQEANAVVSYEERDKNQAETLKMVFVTYFRILKARSQHLMGAVLEGLAKYSHLINQDFFGDVLEALKDLINETEAALKADQEQDEEEDELNDRDKRNATRESLLCVITAFALLQGQQDVAKSANSLHLDLSFFITHLYRTLLPLSMDVDIELSAKTARLADPNGLDLPSDGLRDTSSTTTKVNVATTTVLLLRSLQSVLLPPTNIRAVPPVRAAAFIKQLMTLTLHLPQKSAIAVLELLRAVTKTHGARVAALWNTEERRRNGVFDGLSREVESSNPFASTVWEGELLRLHFDPKVREAVVGIEGNVRVEGG